LQTGRFEDPGKHGGGGGFAMRAGNHENFFAKQKFVMQNLRQRAEGDALVEHAFQFRIAARNRIADNDEVRPRIEVRGGERLGNGNAERFEKR
jgi:hypothetical protein